MSWPRVIERVKAGEHVELHPAGNSMTPRIKSKDRVVVSRVDTSTLKLNDIVLARVKGRYFLHLISAIDGDRIQISNNHGHVNGWTTRERVFARVTEIRNRRLT